MRQPFAMKFCLAALAATLVCAPLPAAPNATVEVEQAVRQLLLEQAARDGLLEPQLVLETIGTQAVRVCRETPTVAALDTRHASRMRFAAVCASENWRQEYTVRAELSARVVVSAARIAAGQPIAETALRIERRVLATPQEALSDPAQLVGQASRRALQPGQMVERRMLQPAVLVRRGAVVRIVARNAGIEVTSAGQATEAGHRDDVIGVRNAATGKLIRARVTGVDEVEPAGIAPAVTPQSP